MNLQRHLFCPTGLLARLIRSFNVDRTSWLYRECFFDIHIANMQVTAPNLRFVFHSQNRACRTNVFVLENQYIVFANFSSLGLPRD